MTLALHRRAGQDVDATTLYELLRLRVEVFVVEQSCAYREIDGLDLLDTTQHFWLENTGGEVVSTLRLLQEGAPATPLFRIGRVCTNVGERGRGHADRLMRAALSEVGTHPCRISAQTYLTEMYARYGFTLDGEEFLEDGIAHVSMLRSPMLAVEPR